MGYQRKHLKRFIADYRIAIALEEDAEAKARQFISEGFQPWGPPSFIQTADGQVSVCQSFVRKEEEYS